MAARNFVLVNSDRALLEEKIKEILSEYDENIDVNYRHIEEDGLPSILAELNTPSLLSESKCIIVNDATLIDTKVNETFYEHLLKYITNPAPFSILILVYNEAKTTERFKELKKYSIYLESKEEKLSSRDYLLKYLARESFRISDDAMDYLFTYGDETLLLKNMLDSLICHNISEKMITKEDILDFFLPPLENNIFEFTNAILRHDRKLAYKLYADFSTQNISITYLLGLVINKFQEMYNNYVLYYNGFTQNDFAELYSVKPGRAFYMIKDIKTYSLDSIKDNLLKLNKIEFDIKKGSIDGDIAITSYILSI